VPYRHDPHELLGRGIYRLSGANNPEWPEGALQFANNIVYDRSSQEPEKMRGYTLLGDDVNGTVSGLFDYSEGTEMIATSEDGGIYKRTTGNWSAVSGGAAGTFTTTANKRWEGVMFYGATTTANLLILTNNDTSDAPQKYTSGAGISALGGSPPAAGRFPTPAFGRMWMSVDDTIFYSAADNAENFSGGGSFQVDRGTGSITGLREFMGNLIIFKRNHIFRLSSGDTLSSAVIKRISGTLGTQASHTIQETSGSFRSGSLLFQSDEGIHEMVPTLATGGFFVRNAGEWVKPISDRRDKTNQDMNWSTYNPSRGEYWWQYTLDDAQPDEGLIGNVAGGGKNTAPRWTTHDLRNRTAGAMVRVDGELIQIMGDANGTVFKMNSGDDRNGASYTGSITTAAYSQNYRGSMKKYGRIYLDAETEGTYSLTVHTQLGRSGLPIPGGNSNSPGGFGDAAGWADGEWGVAMWGGATVSGNWFRIGSVRRGSYIMIRIQSTSADQWFKLNGLDIEYVRRRYILAA